MAAQGPMSPTQSREMAKRIESTKALNVRRAAEEAAFRATDPLECAKTLLRRRGWHVFRENVLPGFPRSQRIIVGRTPMDAEDVMAMADRLKARAA